MAIFLFCIWAAGWARSGDEFLGFWFSEGRNSVIEIFEENETYEARIVRLKYPLYPEGHVYADREIMDLENPDPDLQPRTLAGITFAWGFVFDAKSARWVDGRIYNPETGKTYFAFMEMKTPNSLRIKGSLDYHGWFGKSTFWQRADADSLLWFEKAKPAGMVVPAITGEMRDSSVEDMDSLFRK